MERLDAGISAAFMSQAEEKKWRLQDMRELSDDEYRIQKALGTLQKYEISITEFFRNRRQPLRSILIDGANLVDALHKAWLKNRR